MLKTPSTIKRRPAVSGNLSKRRRKASAELCAKGIVLAGEKRQPSKMLAGFPDHKELHRHLLKETLKRLGLQKIL